MGDYITNFLKVRLKAAAKYLEEGDAFNVKGREWADNYIEDISYLLALVKDLEVEVNE